MTTMSKEELRIKIAQMLGYKFAKTSADSKQVYFLSKNDAGWNWHLIEKPEFCDDILWESGHIPDYPNSIEAAMQLEEVLPVEKRVFYYFELIRCCEHDDKSPTNYELVHATAEQRCKAWVEVMEAK